MDFLRQQLDKIEHHFEKGGKYEALYPLYEGADTILFTPSTVTKGASHVRDQLDQAVARTEGLQPGRRVFHALTGLTVVAVLQWLVPDPERARWLFGGLLATLLGFNKAEVYSIVKQTGEVLV